MKGLSPETIGLLALEAPNGRDEGIMIMGGEVGEEDCKEDAVDEGGDPVSKSCKREEVLESTVAVSAVFPNRESSVTG